MKIKFRKRTYLVLLLILVPFLFFYDSPKPVRNDYNVVLIVLDTLRADHIGGYGYRYNTTPNIDEIIGKSILFKNAFSQSSHTTSSHMSIFTSLHPKSHNVMHSLDTLEQGITTLAQTLKETGYESVWVAYTKDSTMDLTKGFERGFEHFIESYPVDLHWESGLEWVRKNKNRNFFMFLHTYKIHDPYTPLKDSVLNFVNNISDELIISRKELSRGLFDLGVDKVFLNPSIMFKSDFISENTEIFSNKSLLREYFYSLQDVNDIHRTFYDVTIEIYWNLVKESDNWVENAELFYDAEIYETDSDVKKVFDTLEEEGLLDKTIVIITADHGEEFLEHDGIQHGTTLYDEVLHVPLIIWIPGYQSKEVDALVGSVDIMPTILDLLGLNIPEQAQGKSLLSLINGEVESVHDYVYAETFQYLSSIRSKKWKLITDFRNITELYDLESDPEEKNSLAGLLPETVEELKTKLEEHLTGGVIKK